METGPWLKVSSDRLVKPGIEPATPGLQGKWFIHYTTAAPFISLLYLDLYVLGDDALVSKAYFMQTKYLCVLIHI